jgi:hypothetical protein
LDVSGSDVADAQPDPGGYGVKAARHSIRSGAAAAHHEDGAAGLDLNRDRVVVVAVGEPVRPAGPPAFSASVGLILVRQISEVLRARDGSKLRQPVLMVASLMASHPETDR